MSGVVLSNSTTTAGHFKRPHLDGRPPMASIIVAGQDGFFLAGGGTSSCVTD